MRKAGDLAYRFRFWLLATGLAAVAAGMWWALGAWPLGEVGPAGVPFVEVTAPFDSPYNEIIWSLVFVGCVLLTQWAFLAPRRRWRVPVTDTGRPLWRSLIVAALLSALLSVGVLATLLEIPDWWEKVLGAHAGPGGSGYQRAWIAWIALGTLWVLWAIILFFYWRGGDRYHQLSRLANRLLTGSILSALVAAPVHVWTERHNSCYCQRGSYTGMVLGLTVATWAFGPAIILLFLRERHRRETRHRVCTNCAYDLRGTIAAGRTSCPECGYEITET